MGNSRRSMTILLSSAVFAIAVVLAVGGTAYAVSGYLNAFEAAYPAAVGTRIDACLLCHVNSNPNQGSARNNFGSDFASGGHNFDAALEAMDSDGDGILNGAEIAALTFPGNPNDPAAAGPQISVDPASNNYGSVTVGSSSSQVFTVSNTGTADLVLTDGVLDDTTNFSLDLNGGGAPCGDTPPPIAPGGNCTVSAAFSPTSVGAFSASITVTSNDPVNSSLDVPLTGTGILVDTDGDGVADSVDDFPNDASKATPQSATGTGKITLDAGTNALSMVSAVAVAPGQAVSGFTFPDGLATFQVAVAAPGDNATVTVAFPSGQPFGSTYFKADGSGTLVEFAGATINPDNVVLMLTDGGSGDNDNTAGVITDPGGLATPVPSSSGGGGGGSCSVIGSSGGGGALLFLTLLAILVALRLRRQTARAGR